jgi:CubicO group peptidase (beta-lactamase class C family)
MSLIDRGGLEDDHLLARYIPDFPSADRITIDMLLRHRSGIPHRVTGPADEADPKTPADMVRLAAARPLIFEPGSSSLYSTAGYSVLARVLEIASGKRYGDLLRETVLAPAGATHTVDPDGRKLIPGRALSFVPGADGFERAPARELSFLVGGGSAYSTPRDVHAVIAALLAGTYGPAARTRLVQQGVIRWNGVTNGYRAFADHDSAAGTTIVFTGNVHTGAIDMLRRDLPRLLAGEAVPAPAPPRVVPRPVAAAARAAASGSYDVFGSPVLLRFDQPAIVTFGDRVLFAVNDSTLFSPQDYAEVSMVRGAAGTVDTLRWGPDGPRFVRSAPAR